MPARLNRRRYREIVAALKEVIADPKATRMQRLRAVDTLIGVYDRHDRTEAQKEQRRRAAEATEAAQGAGQPDTSSEPPASTETAEEAAARFLQGILRKEPSSEQRK